MAYGVYSDPYLKQLSQESPLLAFEYFQLIFESKYRDELADCLETPEELLAQLGTKALTKAEQKAALALNEVPIPIPEERNNYLDGWLRTNYPSSLAFLTYFQCSRTWDRDKIDSIKGIPETFIDVFAKLGHPFSALLPNPLETNPILDEASLREMISEHNLLHRLLWPELCRRSDFHIYRRMAYRTDDVFISHPILGRDFENAEPESARDLGGVFTYSDNFDWLIGHKELSLENALFELKASGETLVETVNNVSRFEILGLQLVALTIEEPELAEKYGYQLTNIAEDWVIEEVTIEINVTYPEGFDVSAEINPNFPEMLGWSKLPDSNKAYIFGLLKIGSVMPLSKVSSDSVHFLGCMALHADTPDFLLKELGSLGIPIIDEVLASRD